ncbi:uncharacterized protein LOC116616885 [Nematostella vectensis]|uniref:uncharacterized protein LOC116616885 n=1 Tax=Nematostella vectensis TaxID=45351 RepID=UPI00139049AE|nr:uncharacterized protein LOC116616885 [Nematostella vectensis]
MECAVVFFMLVFATFHLKVACLSCIFCVSPSNPAACTDEFEIGCWSGMQCFWAVGRVWNGSETVIVYSKGFAPCHTRQIACNYINRTISDIWSKDAYLVDCNLKCCAGLNCNAGGTFPSIPPSSPPRTTPHPTAHTTPHTIPAAGHTWRCAYCAWSVWWTALLLAINTCLYQ